MVAEPRRLRLNIPGLGAVIGALPHARNPGAQSGGRGFNFNHSFMVATASGLAAIGLLVNSPAVTIGAMLISPLMGPVGPVRVVPPRGRCGGQAACPVSGQLARERESGERTFRSVVITLLPTADAKGASTNH